MKPSTLPFICGLALAVMSAAGLSHWWSVRQFAAALQTSILAPPSPAKPAGLTPTTPAPPELELLAQAPKHPAPTTDAAQKKFFEALVSKIEKLQNQNQDLLDQMAETNRDVMKLEFRVDTHSESFRPMPVSEERLDTSFDTGPGVLPPRAEPVFLPSGE
jgi:hypothetical protein